MKKEYCKRGHKRTSDNLIGRTCKQCHALAERKRRTHCNMGHERTPENLYPNGTCKQCAKFRAIRWAEANPSKRKKVQRLSLWKTRYKLTEDMYNAILAKQNGVCAICKKPPFLERVFIIDHNHACCPGQECCGKCVRGLIHQSCNSALGSFSDSPAVCRNAAEYLENPPANGVV